MPGGALIEPWRMRGPRRFYSSGSRRDFYGLSMRQLRHARLHRQLLGMQVRLIRAADDDDESVHHLRRTLRFIDAYLDAYFERVAPAGQFGSTFRRNCALTDVLDYCGEDYRLRRR